MVDAVITGTFICPLPPTFKVKQLGEKQNRKKNKASGADENKKTKKQKDNQTSNNMVGNRTTNEGQPNKFKMKTGKT